MCIVIWFDLIFCPACLFFLLCVLVGACWYSPGLIHLSCPMNYWSILKVICSKNQGISRLLIFLRWVACKRLAHWHLALSPNCWTNVTQATSSSWPAMSQWSLLGPIAIRLNIERSVPNPICQMRRGWVFIMVGPVAVSYCSRIYADVLFALTRAAEPAIQPCEFHKQFPRKLVCRIISFMMYGSFGKEPFWQLPRIEKLFRILLPRDRIHGWELRSRMVLQKPMESRKLFLQVYPILSM